MFYVDGSLDYVLYLVGKIGVNLLKYKNISQITGLYEITCLSSFDSNVLTDRAATEHIGFWWIKYAKKCIYLKLCFILQFSEKVNLHFLGLMEALRECNSLVLAKVWCNSSNIPLFGIPVLKCRYF